MNLKGANTFSSFLMANIFENMIFLEKSIPFFKIELKMAIFSEFWEMFRSLEKKLKIQGKTHIAYSLLDILTLLHHYTVFNIA